ncbi:membrane lipoprotein lipid attachment site-containing protein [Bacillaceae bacterium S4-13-58]
MKKLILALIFVFLLAGCNNEKVVQPDTPFNAAHLLKFQIDNQNYSAFQSLFSEETEDAVSKKTFQQFGEISTSGANYKNFELLTFDNGEMLLVEFKPKLDNEDEYKIVNVQVVPKEMKELFERK